jgi:hypothetical protein
MQLRARRVLDDARVALEWLDDDSDKQLFRIRWVGFCALLRTVGHVLDKVDAAASAVVRTAVNAQWHEWRNSREKHEIFWDFIEAERNAVLKTYEVSYLETDEPVVVITGDDEPDQYRFEPSLFRPITDGPFAGYDARDIGQEAIAWWDEQLQVIEKI